MAKSVHTFDDYVSVLRRSRLVEETLLDRIVAEFSRRAEGAPQAWTPLAERLLADRLITRWQHAHLKEGRSKGFYLGRYKLQSFLGTGGMSTVYLALHTLMGREVALKVLMEGQVESTTLERFRRECRAIAALDHPNIVRAHDFDSDGKFHYLVMEFVPGQDLQAIVEKHGPLSDRQAADFARQAALGLSHAHHMGFIHRDIKPANLLISTKRVVKILDMGVAKITELDHTKLTIDNQQNLLGTVDFLAPEQALDSHAVDARADIYSLGCTLYFCLTGEPPFNVGTQAQRLLAHQIQPVPDIRRKRQHVSPGLIDICLKMLAKKPERRYANASAVAEALQAWLDSGDDAGPDPSVIEASQNRNASTNDTRDSKGQGTVAVSQPMVRITCTACQSRFGAPPQKTARKIKCPHCGAVLVLPATDDESGTAESGTAESGTAESDPPTPPKAADHPESVNTVE